MPLVKFLCAGIADLQGQMSWQRQLPSPGSSWGECQFTFDPTCDKYDWLVVYDRFPSVSGERFSHWREQLPCPPERTLFVTVEPSSIKVYDRPFLRQFGYILTGHEPWSIDQPGVIRSQPGLKWFYGDGGTQLKTYDTMANEAPIPKLHDLSTVCSAKKQKHTLHAKRFEFTAKLKQALPDLEIFGKGVRPMADKADAVNAYRYHVAIENHACDHHCTEKISDAFLGWSLPFYYGCTNLRDYFPCESFVEIDIDDVAGTVKQIRETISGGLYEKRLDAIQEARKRVLTQYNLFAVINSLITNPNQPEPNKPDSSCIFSRHAIRSQRLYNQFDYVMQTARRHWRTRFKI